MECEAMFDKDTQRLVRIFQKVFNLSYVERDQVKYVKRYARAIEWVGQLFEYLGLAKLNKQSPLGWRPTPVLLSIMNKQRRISRKPGRQTNSQRLTPYILAARCRTRRREASLASLLTFGFKVLQELGLMRGNREGDCTVPPPVCWELFMGTATSRTPE